MRKDIDISFAVHPLTGDLATKTDSQAIKQSLINLVLTSFYERGYNTECGTNVNASLFENNISGLTSQGMRQIIINTISNYEPQVDLIDVEVLDADNGNALNVNIIYNERNREKEQTLLVRI
ncbi:MAG: GPW/gp25 family protein [Nitrosopumilaceae archaeon]|nr:GPW/gp25 family protein [Nitrosopumilaceae archaeon]